MIKSYKLKIYANKAKIKKLNELLSFWRDQVNRKIKIFWQFNDAKGPYCPTQFALGGRLIRDASTKAWQIVKRAKRAEQEKRPYFKGTEIDLNQASAYIIPEFKTKEFDIWFNVISLNSRHRLKIPCKKTKLFNQAVATGKLKKSLKVQKTGRSYYVICFIDLPEIEQINENLIGIDVGLNNAIATSDGRILGKELKNLRIRTKYRKYRKKISPIKQGLNYYAKKLLSLYPDTDFVVERLLFKGKRKRSKKFRRRNNNWAYNHLAKKLKEIGKLKGFQLLKVNPAYSSQKCPVCGFTDKMNRRGSLFLCSQCGYMGNIDVVGAINLVGRVIREQSVPLNQIGKINVH